jgi:hypothetical protein
MHMQMVAIGYRHCLDYTGVIATVEAYVHGNNQQPAKSNVPAGKEASGTILETPVRRDARLAQAGRRLKRPGRSG